jgi:hypothetical protein
MKVCKAMAPSEALRIFLESLFGLDPNRFVEIAHRAENGETKGRMCRGRTGQGGEAARATGARLGRGSAEAASSRDGRARRQARECRSGACPLGRLRRAGSGRTHAPA